MQSFLYFIPFFFITLLFVEKTPHPRTVPSLQLYGSCLWVVQFSLGDACLVSLTSRLHLDMTNSSLIHLYSTSYDSTPVWSSLISISSPHTCSSEGIETYFEILGGGNIISKHDLSQKITRQSYSSLLRCTPSLPGTKWLKINDVSYCAYKKYCPLAPFLCLTVLHHWTTVDGLKIFFGQEPAENTVMTKWMSFWPSH